MTDVANKGGEGIPPGSVGDSVASGLGGIVGAFVGKFLVILVGPLVGSVEGELVILRDRGKVHLMSLKLDVE